MVKRLFDIVASGVGILILLPLLIVLAVIVKLTSPGKVFYKATRVGRYGNTFQLYKFRSMIVDAEKMGPGITLSGDVRVTKVGGFLRRTKLDELPQLFNVIKGEMSLVGPRPEDPRYVALYSSQQSEVLNVRPGITSPASLYYRNEESLLEKDNWEDQYIQQIMPAKLAIDLNYVQNGNLVTDLLIIFRTFKTILSPKL